MYQNLQTFSFKFNSDCSNFSKAFLMEFPILNSHLGFSYIFSSNEIVRKKTNQFEFFSCSVEKSNCQSYIHVIYKVLFIQFNLLF